MPVQILGDRWLVLCKHLGAVQRRHRGCPFIGATARDPWGWAPVGSLSVLVDSGLPVHPRHWLVGALSRIGLLVRTLEQHLVERGPQRLSAACRRSNIAIYHVPSTVGESAGNPRRGGTFRSSPCSTRVKPL